MPDENETQTATTEAGTAATEVTTEATTDETTEQPKVEEVPAEVLREKLTQANAEAANYRVQLRAAQEQLGNAKTPEEFEAATAELNTKIAELERNALVSRVALEAKLPADLAAVLQGNTEDELKAHAKTLAKYVTPEEIAPEALRGGLSPAEPDSDEGLNPRELAAKHRRRR